MKDVLLFLWLFILLLSFGLGSIALFLYGVFNYGPLGAIVAGCLISALYYAAIITGFIKFIKRER